MRDDQVDAIWVTVANWRAGDRIQVWYRWRMRDVERVVLVDVAISSRTKIVEDVRLERVSGFHDESVQIKPPKPVQSK